MKAPRHFLDLDQIAPEELRRILALGAAYKADRAKGERERPLAGKTLAMIFEKPSTRTRVSFEVGMKTLGGYTVVLSASETQLERGESAADTARVLSRYVDAIMLRTRSHDVLLEFAHHAEIPVINGLTDRSHPCQLLADVMTVEERKGPIAGRIVAWLGDGNNVAASWIHAAVQFGFELRLGCPPEYGPPVPVLEWATARGGRVSVTEEPASALAGADCVVTDTWVSMNVRDSAERRRRLEPYRVTPAAMARAKPDALFLHCLPAKRGQEVAAEVIDGPQSVVWDEAENRIHAQKGVLLWCLA
ncbi:MAG TPA: ornithine carbamoyltransferase [Alphaproteobacteria bacterium]|nr:ornithine carbamoyltransferase [Alphaproteobacteria bacterium]